MATKPRWKFEHSWSAWTCEYLIKTATINYKLVAVVKSDNGICSYNLFRGHRTEIPIGGGRAASINDCKYHAEQMVKSIQKQHAKNAHVVE